MVFDAISAATQLAQGYGITGTRPGKTDATAKSALPASWGSDTTSFSPEALAALDMAAVAAKQPELDEGKEENGAAAEFSKYLRQARGEESASSGSLEEELENLKERLRKLEEKKQKEAEKAAEEGASGTLQTRFEALDEEIAQVASQIAELEQMLLKMNGKGGGGFKLA